MNRILVACLGLLAAFDTAAAPGRIILFNGTSSAGKSSLAEVVVQESKTKYEVVSFDDFHQTYRSNHPGRSYSDFMIAFYQHARQRADDGNNIIIDTVEFDNAYDRHCAILGCSNVVKAAVYCPLDQILKRIDRRNSAEGTNGRRPVLLSFRQFLNLYKLQSSPDDLVVERTDTRRIRAALIEAGKRTRNSREYEALYSRYVAAYGIDQDKELILVPKQKYDLVLDTRARTKKENLRMLEDHMKRRPSPDPR